MAAIHLRLHPGNQHHAPFARVGVGSRVAANPAMPSDRDGIQAHLFRLVDMLEDRVRERVLGIALAMVMKVNPVQRHAE
jgi:hypothetical protein